MIYHITSKAEWLVAKAAGVYEPESIAREGFVHCSSEEHVMHVANFYFKGFENLVILEIEENKLKAEIKWEDSGGRKFPHVYGPIEADAVERVADLTANEDGEFEFPFKPVLH